MIEKWACGNKFEYLRKERRRKEGGRRCILQRQFGGYVVAVHGSQFISGRGGWWQLGAGVRIQIYFDIFYLAIR